MGATRPGNRILLKGAVSRRSSQINSPGLACRNELDSDVLGDNIALIPDDVCVCATGINKRHSNRIDVRRTGRIVSLIVGQCSGRDDDQAVARVRMPTGVRDWLAGLRRGPSVALYIEVGVSPGFLQRHPDLPVIIV